jgi:hypothetical protein
MHIEKDPEVAKGQRKLFIIRSPKFILYQLVTLCWGGIEYPTMITEASFRLSSGEWTYQVARVSDKVDEYRFFYGAVLEPRSSANPCS